MAVEISFGGKIIKPAGGLGSDRGDKTLIMIDVKENVLEQGEDNYTFGFVFLVSLWGNVCALHLFIRNLCFENVSQWLESNWTLRLGQINSKFSPATIRTTARAPTR